MSTTENVVTSAFASDGADTHLSTDMLVATDAGFTTIVQTVTGRTTSPTIIALAGLANNKAHYTKIRHVGVNGGAGDWSDVTSFQTSKKLGESFASISGIAGTIGTRVSGGKLSIVSRGTTGYVSGDNGASWAANPLPSSNTSDVVYALDKVLGSYVMCRSGVKVSQDGVTFPFDAISPPGQLNAIASDGVVAVAVGNFNVYTSQDLISWTIRASVTSSKTIKGVAYSSELDLFVAVGTSGTVLTSKDGITWVARAAPTTYYFQCIVAAFGKFFASVSNGSVNSIFSTSDGVSWTETHSLPSAVYNQSLVFDGDRILCAPSGIAKLFESFDGVSFIQVSSLPAAGTWIFADKSVVLVNTSSGLLVSSA